MSGLGVLVQAGGPGARLRGHFSGPKALAPFSGGTLLDHQLDRVTPLRPRRLVVLACAGAQQVRDHVAGRAEVIVEPRPLGTAGGLALLPSGPERWLLLNVDHVSDLDLPALLATEAPVAAVQPFEVVVDEGVVEVEAGLLTAVHERPRLPMYRTIGAYVFPAALLRGLAAEPLDMPELLARLAPGGLRVHLHRGTWFDAGTPERLSSAEAWLAAGRPER